MTQLIVIMIRFTKLHKTLLLISIASSFIYFSYTSESKEKNSGRTKKTPKLEENTRELLLLLRNENSPQPKEENAKSDEKIRRLKDNKNRDLKAKKTQRTEHEVKDEGAELSFCQPKTNIAFLKTHKTAGSSVMVLFHRFANTSQLIVALPVHLDEVKTFRRCSLYPLKAGYEYNIFAHHTIFNYEEMKDVMPEDTTFLTILREPAAQFESAYSYYAMEQIYGMNISAYADLDTSLPEWSRIKKVRKNDKNGLNPSAFDLGLDPELFENEEAILRKIQKLDRQFDLVMIAELYDESMILMKEKLCWDELMDVAGIEHNVRKTCVKVSLSSEQKEKLREKNRADLMIYDHFRRKLLKQIDAFGKERMAEEVRKLRALIREMREVCVERDSSLKKIRRTRMKAGAEEHRVCEAIAKDERPEDWLKFSVTKFEKAIEC